MAMFAYNLMDWPKFTSLWSLSVWSSMPSRMATSFPVSTNLGIGFYECYFLLMHWCIVLKLGMYLQHKLKKFSASAILWSKLQ